MRAAVLLAGILMLGIMSSASGEVIYKWIDDEGVTHFSEAPPPGVAAEPTSIRTRYTNRQALQARLDTTATQNAAIATRKQHEKEQAAENKIETDNARQTRAGKCERAKTRLLTYNTARRLYRPLENGEREYLTDEQLDNERAEAEQLVNDFCD